MISKSYMHHGLYELYGMHHRGMNLSETLHTLTIAQLSFPTPRVPNTTSDHLQKRIFVYFKL